MLKYIFRLDDACPSMNHKNWSRILAIFDKYNIKPIIAVIPNNEDPSNIIDHFDNDFWKKVILWHKKGYELALHGYNHRYTTKSSGIIGYNNYSEFAGVPYSIQAQKIKKGYRVFKELDLDVNIWIAPAHSFDNDTIKALRNHTDIQIISDGLSIYPYTSKKMFWLPQQLWGPQKKEKGVWTICYHPNTIDNKSFDELDDFISKNRKYCDYNIKELRDLYGSRNFNFTDLIFKHKFLFLRKLRKIKIFLIYLFNKK